MTLDRYLEQTRLTPLEATTLWRACAHCAAENPPIQAIDTLSDPAFYILQSESPVRVSRSPDTPARESEDREPPIRALARLGTVLMGSTRAEEAIDSRTSSLTPDPVLQLLFSRVVAMASADGMPTRYRTIEPLIRDLDRLIAYQTVPASRRSLVDDLVATASGSGRARDLLVIGEPGIGKSYLLRAVQSQWEHNGTGFVSMKVPQAGTQPFFGLAAVLRAIAGRSISLPIDEILTRSAVGPRVRDLIRLMIPDPARESSGSSRMNGTLTADDVASIASVVHSIALESGTTVLCIDDVQWLDQQTLDIVGAIIRMASRSLSVVLIGRPEISPRIPEGIRIEPRTVGPLDDDEQAALMDSLWILTDHGTAPELAEWVVTHTSGNPMEIVDTVRGLARSARLGRVENPPQQMSATEGSTTRLTRLAEDAIERLSSPARRAVHMMSLLLPPVPIERLKAVFDDIEALLNEAAAESVIESSRDSVWFRHDTIESAARDQAVGDSGITGTAVRLLSQAAIDGDARAAFVLARAIGAADAPADAAPGRIQSHGSDTDTAWLTQAVTQIEPHVVVHVLQAGARHALELVLSAEALRYCTVAIQIAHAESLPTLPLHLIAHRAAFLSDDPRAMSRHFNAIKATGDPLVTNEARLLWISRSYIKTWIRGAMHIGFMVLRELGALPDTALTDQRPHLPALGSLLKGRIPELLAWRLTQRGQNGDMRSLLVMETCGRLMLPVLTLHPELLSVMATLILRESFTHGVGPYSGYGFVYWMMDAGRRDRPARLRYRLGTLARRIERQTGAMEPDPIIRHAVHCVIFFSTIQWERSHFADVKTLRDLYDQGIRIGSYEAASNAGLLSGQRMLFHGQPLDQVLRELKALLAVIGSLGQGRSINTLGKYAQAAENLQTGADDLAVLTGSICSEPELVAALEQSEDLLGLTGVRVLKAALALFQDDPRNVLRLCREAAPRVPMAFTVTDTTFTWYLHAGAAYRLGHLREGRKYQKKLRPWMFSAPANHRYVAATAERYAAQRRIRAASRCFLRARRLALKNGFAHEAAIFAERQGDTVGHDPRFSIVAAEAYHSAHSLYQRWQAPGLAARVRAKLGWTAEEVPDGAARPPLNDSPIANPADTGEGRGIHFVSALLGAATAAETTAQAAERIAQELGALRVELHAHTADRTDRATCPPSITDREDRPESAAGPIRHYRYDYDQQSRFVLSVEHPANGAQSADTDGYAHQLLCEFAAVYLLRLNEEELRQNRQALLNTQGNIHLLVAGIGDALLLVDAPSEVLFHNPAAAEYLYATASDATELDPDFGRLIAAAMERCLSDGSGYEQEVSWNNRVVRVTLNPAPRASRSRRPLLTLVIRDVTAFRTQEQQLIIADRLSSLGMLASTIAHEVGNPNHIVKLNTETLRLLLSRSTARDDGTVDECRRVLDQVAEGSQRIDDVIRQVKEFGREGRNDEWSVVDPDEVCRRVIRFSRIFAAQYTDRLRSEPGRDVPPIRAVRSLLEQALINLLQNACEALPSREAEIVITTAYDPTEQVVLLAVCDEGPGIDPSYTTGTGAPFQTGRAHEGGTGLGLSIVRTIATRHGGTLRYRSNERFATVAELVIPVGE